MELELATPLQCIKAFDVKNVVLHMVLDNQPSAFIIIKGSAKSPLAEAILLDLYQECRKRNISLIISYIRSKRNLSDPPSRVGKIINLPVDYTEKKILAQLKLQNV